MKKKALLISLVSLFALVGCQPTETSTESTSSVSSTTDTSTSSSSTETKKALTGDAYFTTLKKAIDNSADLDAMAVASTGGTLKTSGDFTITAKEISAEDESTLSSTTQNATFALDADSLALDMKETGMAETDTSKAKASLKYSGSGSLTYSAPQEDSTENVTKTYEKGSFAFGIYLENTNVYLDLSDDNFNTFLYDFINTWFGETTGSETSIPEYVEKDGVYTEKSEATDTTDIDANLDTLIEWFANDEIPQGFLKATDFYEYEGVQYMDFTIDSTIQSLLPYANLTIANQYIATLSEEEKAEKKDDINNFVTELNKFIDPEVMTINNFTLTLGITENYILSFDHDIDISVAGYEYKEEEENTDDDGNVTSTTKTTYTVNSFAFASKASFAYSYTNVTPDTKPDATYTLAS